MLFYRVIEAIYSLVGLWRVCVYIYIHIFFSNGSIFDDWIDWYFMLIVSQVKQNKIHSNKK